MFGRFLSVLKGPPAAYAALPFYGFDSLGTYSRIEQKDENITIGQLKQIAAILHVSLIDLLPDELVIANKLPR